MLGYAHVQEFLDRQRDAVVRLATRQAFFSNHRTSANCRNVSLRQKTFQSFAIDDELAIVARNQMLSLEQNQMFGDSGPRGACRFSKLGPVRIPWQI